MILRYCNINPVPCHLIAENALFEKKKKKKTLDILTFHLSSSEVSNPKANLTKSDILFLADLSFHYYQNSCSYKGLYN